MEYLLLNRQISGRYALEKGFPGLRVSDAETLSLQKSAKSSVKNTELASLRQLYFWHWRRFLRAKSFYASCKRKPGKPFSRAGIYQPWKNKERDVQPWNKGRAQRKMVCGCFRFRDQEFLKFPIFAKNETKIHKLAALRQCEFSFPRKTQKFKDF